MTIAARVVLEGAERTRAAGGTTGGFLCERHGLLPCEPPLTALPRSHAAWDEAAAAMPEMFRSLRGRETLDAMPELPADAAALPERYLHRACALLGMLAHTYVRVRPDPPERLPSTIAVPWAVLSRRLGRDATTLTYDDLIAYNWRLRDPSAPEPRTLERLDLLFPTVGNREEQVFYLAQVEMHAEGAPLIGAMVRAQEAVAADDPAGLELEIAAMQDVIERLTYGSFLKVDANPHSATYVDPVVWAKTVAPFAVSISQGAHAISGAAAPIFQLLDAFVGRSRFDSRIGRETRSLQSGYPREMREFLHALAGTSVGAYVGRCGSRRLSGLWQGLLDAYVGNHGFLGVHRRKAYAFLEVAFKVGRSVTTGGFTGLFEEQTWEVANQELELARRERHGSVGGGCPMGAVSASRGELTSPGLVHLRLDMAGSGLRFRPGDRLAVQPRNDPQLVARTLRSLQAAGDEPVPLDGTWRSALAELYSDAPPHRIPLRELLDA
ncbi:MAG: hypothetical protein QOJ69_2386, partial [Actinomycetota bacterium]|nr:hypothetical protein [Actinomycetota bacterium]